jgi:hypothetical protein
MDDGNIGDRIGRLVAEEHELYERHSADGLSDEERQRLQDIAVNLDQCWDFLRQRRALREFGMNPDEAHVRDAKTVENYLQ